MKIFLKINQITQLLHLAEQRPRDAALFHLAFCTGFRISDLLALKRTNLVDKQGDVVKVLRFKTKKTKKWLDKPLRDDCRQAIKEYLGTRKDANPYMFPPIQTKSRYGTTRGPMSRMSAHRLYKKYLENLYDGSELAGASTHTLRRSVGKIISEKTGRIEASAKFLGHTNISSTMAYIDANSWEEKANEVALTIDI
jgi:integrase